ncbi:MAG: hypothetical protein HQ591_08065 [candidate division Zixibacteria bacterium]|nr:hypothetical protein [Candidatus Tariuqbacter arcticus]
MRNDFSFCVVDTNVPLAANKKSWVSNECVIECMRVIEVIMKRGRIVLDDKWIIIKEYMNKLSPSGQPGVGDMFLKWVLTNQFNNDRCARVAITPKIDDSTNFDEFPNHPGLIEFDPDDRKSVAVSVVHPEHPPILQATDTVWWGWKEALAECDIKVVFLCPEEIEKRYKSTR